MNGYTRRSFFLAALALCVGAGGLELSPLTLQAAAAESRHSATNAAPAAVEVPKSTFNIPTAAAEGRDPFFPLSRKNVVEVSPDPTPTPKPAPLTLVLKGVGGNESKRFALINDKTFAAGEEREVAIGNTRANVLCVEIREDSVVIEVNGARQQLRLRQGL
jgi:hypothetical protein